MKTRKFITLGIMGTVLVSMLFYMGGAFANASFYLNKWSDVSRSMIAFFGIFIIILVWCAIANEIVKD